MCARDGERRQVRGSSGFFERKKKKPKQNVPDPTTTKTKKPSRMGPTREPPSFFFCA